MRLLLIGGSGFLSGTLARAALTRGHAVTVITRGRRPVPPGVTAIVADRDNREEFARHIAGLDATWDVVVDTIPYTPEHARQDIEVFAGRANRLVFVSTDFVYDPQRRIIPQPESDAAYATDGYGGRKRQAELVLENSTGLPWTILRPSHIYGPGSLPGCLPRHSRDPQLVDDILAGRPLRLVGGGRFLQHPIFAPDLATAILDAAVHPAAAQRTFNVAGPQVVASKAYYHALGALLGRKVIIEDVPVSDFLTTQPDQAPFCCDRVYDLTAWRTSGLALPATSLESGLRSLLMSSHPELLLPGSGYAPSSAKNAP